MGKFSFDPRKKPAEIDLTVTDGIGKNGDRLRDRPGGVVVKGIVEQGGDTLRFFAPPPGEHGRPTAFPEDDEGLVGSNLYVVFERVN